MIIYGVKYNYLYNPDTEGFVLENTLSTNVKKVREKADELNTWNNHNTLYFYSSAIRVDDEE